MFARVKRVRQKRSMFLTVIALIIGIVVLRKLIHYSVQKHQEMSDEYADRRARYDPSPHVDTPFQYISPEVLETWKSRDYLVALGVLSPDISVRRRRRFLQRMTCWTFPDVATKRNNFTGAMIPLYVLARHPVHNFKYSDILKEEARHWEDIITLPIDEGRVSTNKKMGDGTFWGPETEVGMSRKTFMWLDLALNLFGTATFISKADDDMYLRVPQQLANIRVLPTHKLYYGYSMPNRYPYQFRYADGSVFTISRDIAEKVVGYRPLRRLANQSYDRAYLKHYLLLFMDHEDMMVGHTIFRVAKDVTYATVRRCHFHNIYGRFDVSPLTFNSIMLHNIKESEYADLMRHFSNIKPTPTRYVKTSEGIFFECEFHSGRPLHLGGRW
ncbi:UDP-Gal or UDP-GlcNAc-dependent glycosyltransferase, putative [Trypanosoma equiperdum]|uniref:Hexosyltransferase n=3 Tax=Trypanozoon TaxID=39700 RepID=Q57ZV2_TRYB2|nr:UDP-Gal or UDP-GlcNAc-dependent glycosyltransferase, putative [Trypanosoma brucei brucei TREU927]AAX79369.1 UDP-Gal or UDP-GlcNAc-dependent glycosyltransferase, putative [Trypanosoma brucei]AAZ11389.1 UDP-Gal or UDP-GlcNAc-dependent glycosyltransferase, putative [Trypanosoma brucei brucei TREU927]SCU64735.1 UDP-Gal or UDP-GlcNAc-dependent glycosyltransferase, putative [Trypanosoma equiperdum]